MLSWELLANASQLAAAYLADLSYQKHAHARHTSAEQFTSQIVVDLALQFQIIPILSNAAACFIIASVSEALSVGASPELSSWIDSWQSIVDSFQVPGTCHAVFLFRACI